ncbi:MAG: hypothetical protein R2794_04090 [Chitinophagales bacterium]
MRAAYLGLSVLLLVFTACKRSADTQSETIDTPSKDSASALDGITDPIEEAGYLPADDPAWKTIIIDRFHFALEIPATWKALDKSNNGDGYFLDCGVEQADIRVYGENISANPVMAEAELAACDKMEDIHFANGYPGTHCFQGKDDYYYYDTPDLRMIFYVHADAQWKRDHAEVLDRVAKSLYFVQEK